MDTGIVLAKALWIQGNAGLHDVAKESGRLRRSGRICTSADPGRKLRSVCAGRVSHSVRFRSDYRRQSDIEDSLSLVMSLFVLI